MRKSDWPKWHCPVHRKLLKDQREVLICPDGDSFQRRTGIPQFAATTNYVDAFGAQWKKYRLTQLDSYTRTTITRDRVRRCLGEELWGELTDRQVLECGCGAGRFTEILLKQGAYVTSIDLSEAADVNQENFPQDETHRVAQADILKLPFTPRQFDMVFCLGVIQHTSNPEETIACLYEQVRPGGWLIFDHYTYEISWFTKTAPLFRLILRRLPPDKGLKVTERLVNTLLPLHKMVRHFYLAQMLFSRFSPVSCYYHLYPELSDELQREWALLDTHDSLTTWHRHLRSRGDIFRILQRLDLQEIQCHYSGNGIEARGRRPST